MPLVVTRRGRIQGGRAFGRGSDMQSVIKKGLHPASQETCGGGGGYLASVGRREANSLLRAVEAQRSMMIVPTLADGASRIVSKYFLISAFMEPAFSMRGRTSIGSWAVRTSRA